MTIPASNTSPTPDYETWVEACFTLSNKDEYWDRCQLSGEVLAEHLARLFEKPSFLIEKYTRQQLADGTWLICGCVLGFFHKAMDHSVPEPARHRWIQALGTLYTDLFDPLCSSLPTGKQANDPFCVAVFMLWDMDALSFAQTYPELREDCFDVLQVAVNCESHACIRSGLHGIGHWIQGDLSQPGEFRGDAELKARLKKCIDEVIHRYRWQWRARFRETLDRFLHFHSDPSPKFIHSLIKYAKVARSGSLA